MKVNHVVMVEYRLLYGELTGNKAQVILDLVSGLNYDLAFPIIARLNYVVRKNELQNIEQEIIFWFGSASPMVPFYLERIRRAYDQQEQSSLRILNIWSNLTLLECFLESNANQVQDQGQSVGSVTDRLLKAYLIINELYVASFNRNKILASIPDHVGLVMKMGITMTAMLLPYHDLNHIDAADAMIVQFSKAVYFFQFVEKNQPQLLAGFLNSYHAESWMGYLKAIFPIAGHALQSNKEGFGYLTISESEPKAETSRRFLSQLSVGSAESEDLDQDFILLRSRPLMQINAGKFLVIDNLLVYNKIFNSLYFEFNRLIKAEPILFAKGDFKPYYNEYFSESFLTAQVLHEIFAADRYFKITGDEIRATYKRKFTAEPDYYARNQDQVFLFELKDTYVNGDVKQSFDVRQIEHELRYKLWFKEEEKDGKTKIKPKAVRQLLNNIQRAAANLLPFDPELNEKQLVIYPISLYVDQSLSTPGINEIINEWFAFELYQDKVLGAVKDRLDIMPLTMIDLDTLILFQDDFKSGQLSLESLIPAYWTNKSQLFSQGIHEELYAGIFNSMLSFGAFIRKDRLKRKIPEMFNAFGKLLFAEPAE